MTHSGVTVWNARVAIVFGLGLAIGESARNWGNWQWWPFWLVDFIAAALLLAGGLLTLRTHPGARATISGAWGFTCAMFYMSFWSHVRDFLQPADGNIPQTPLTWIIGAMWAISIAGLVAALGTAGSTRREA